MLFLGGSIGDRNITLGKPSKQKYKGEAFQELILSPLKTPPINIIENYIL
jgi:hypothetical protein